MPEKLPRPQASRAKRSSKALKSPAVRLTVGMPGVLHKWPQQLVKEVMEADILTIQSLKCMAEWLEGAWHAVCEIATRITTLALN